jgi:hypothetical protein
VSAGVLKNLPLDSVRDMIVGAIVQAKHGQNVSMLDLGVELAVKFGELLAKAEEPFMPVIAGFIAPIVAGLFGTDVDAEAFARRADRGSRGAASAAIVESFMSSLAGDDGGEVPPGDGGAKRIATAAVHATLEGQLQALATSLLSDIVPFEIGHFDELVNLPEDIIRTLGVSRLVRRAFSPLVDATAATPMKRFANQKYRPNLLAEADIIRAFIAGDYSRDEAGDELAQLGYSDRRQDILLKHATKFLVGRRRARADPRRPVRSAVRDRELARAGLRSGRRRASGARRGSQAPQRDPRRLRGGAQGRVRGPSHFGRRARYVPFGYLRQRRGSLGVRHRVAHDTRREYEAVVAERSRSLCRRQGAADRGVP